MKNLTSTKKSCVLADCSKPRFKHGYCTEHYKSVNMGLTLEVPSAHDDGAGDTDAPVMQRPHSASSSWPTSAPVPHPSPSSSASSSTSSSLSSAYVSSSSSTNGRLVSGSDSADSGSGTTTTTNLPSPARRFSQPAISPTHAATTRIPSSSTTTTTTVTIDQFSKTQPLHVIPEDEDTKVPQQPHREALARRGATARRASSLDNTAVEQLVARRDKVRQALKQKLVESESLYVSWLQVFEKVQAEFDQAIKDTKAPVSEDLSAQLFQNVSQICAFHTRFLALLMQSKNPAEGFASQWKWFSDLYATYLKGFERSIVALHLANDVTVLRETLKRASQVSGKEFPAFLCMPIKRLGLYDRFLNDLHKLTPDNHPEFPTVVAACERMKSVAQLLQSYRAVTDSIVPMVDAQNQIKGQCPPILIPHRMFVRKGNMYMQPSNTLAGSKLRCFFLFTDVLIWTHATDFTYRGTLYMKNAKLSIVGQPLSLSITSADRSMLLTCESEQEFNAWIRDFQTVLSLWTGSGSAEAGPRTVSPSSSAFSSNGLSAPSRTSQEQSLSSPSASSSSSSLSSSAASAASSATAPSAPSAPLTFHFSPSAGGSTLSLSSSASGTASSSSSTASAADSDSSVAGPSSSLRMLMAARASVPQSPHTVKEVLSS